MGEWDLEQGTEENKISEENAKKCVKDLINYYRIDIRSIPDSRQQKIMSAAFTKMVGYYARGLLENWKEGGILKVKQHLASPLNGEGQQTVVYDRMSGEAKLATDGTDPNDRYARIFALLDFLSGNTPGFVKKFSGEDLSVAEDLGAVFLMG